jgi:methylmalonyl-CoA mutase
MTDTTMRLAADFPVPTEAEWRGLVEKILKGSDFEKRLVTKTFGNLSIKPLYSGLDRDVPALLTIPSKALHGWDIRQRHVDRDPATANAAILEDLAGGVTSITLQIEASGQVGLSHDADAMSRALRGVLFDVCPIVLDAGDNAHSAAVNLISTWRATGLANTKCQGAFNLDPLGTLARTGTLTEVADKALDIAVRFTADCVGFSSVTVLAVDGRPYHAAGASEVEELAAILATLVAYLRAGEAVGLTAELLLNKTSVLVSADADLFLTIAKLRAVRLLIQKLAAACGAVRAAQSLHVTASTSERMLTRRDPWVNLLRAATACTASAFGGADAIEVLPYSWPLGIPDAFARRIARNTHIVLQEESGLGRVVDPAAGSWFIEQTTADMAQSAWALFQSWEAAGGMLAVLQSGQVQRTIAATAAARAAALATGKLELTGTSAYPRLGDDGVKITPWPSPSVKLGKPGKPAKQGVATIDPLPLRRLAAPIEALRDRADAAIADGQPMQVFLATLGPLSTYAARALWARNFLAVGGIDVITGPECLTSTEVGAAFAASGATTACLCGSDAAYGELGEAVTSLLKTVGADLVIVAGRPKTQMEALQAAGADRFIYVGCDAIETLSALQAALGQKPT